MMNDRRRSLTETPNPPRIGRIAFALPAGQIALLKAIVESYDNLATIRTEDPRRHHLSLYFSADTEADVMSMLDSLAGRFSIRGIDAGRARSRD